MILMLMWLTAPRGFRTSDDGCDEIDEEDDDDDGDDSDDDYYENGDCDGHVDQVGANVVKEGRKKERKLRPA